MPVEPKEESIEENQPEEETVDRERQQSGKEGVESSHQKEEGVRDRAESDPAAQPTEGAYGEMDRESVSETEPAGAPALEEED
ncbi:MAG: hypothetical protein R3234_00790 [Thermoanaerobaculia bacterium]|nr:hypothetical protein [Thermoanaerobaculia bacterium]